MCQSGTAYPDLRNYCPLPFPKSSASSPFSRLALTLRVKREPRSDSLPPTPPMTLILSEDRAIFGIPIPLSDFPDLVRRHQERFPNTRDIEVLGERVAKEDFRPAAVGEFVREVCRWGRHAGIGARVLGRNSLESIAGSLREAYCLLQSDPSRPDAAIAKVNALWGLGRPSFASKHLRFLRPDICPVLDSILRNMLPYSFDAKGFARFSRDCVELAKTLSAGSLQGLDHRPNKGWLAADVEASLYAYAKGL